MTTQEQWLTAAQLTQYHEQGFVVVEDLIDSEIAQHWKDALKTRLTAEGKIQEPSGVRVWMAYKCGARFIVTVMKIIAPAATPKRTGRHSMDSMPADVAAKPITMQPKSA